MSEDFYHKDKAEAMLSALNEEARMTKDSVSATEL